jgi:hypothetical protein
MFYIYLWGTGDRRIHSTSSSCTLCEDCCNCCCASCGNSYGITPIYGNPCACCESTSGGCCCGECGGGASCGECCASATVADEMIFVVLVICVILALIGVIVSVFAGVIHVSQVFQRHVHIISKKTMTHDAIVMDLDTEPYDLSQRERDIEANSQNLLVSRPSYGNAPSSPCNREKNSYEYAELDSSEKELSMISIRTSKT